MKIIFDRHISERSLSFLLLSIQDSFCAHESFLFSNQTSSHSRLLLWGSHCQKKRMGINPIPMRGITRTGIP
nr:MAG TPA: hypothetical protein [Caudoviricetes sp.]